jgi:hypothetical protein
VVYLIVKLVKSRKTEMRIAGDPNEIRTAYHPERMSRASANTRLFISRQVHNLAHCEFQIATKLSSELWPLHFLSLCLVSCSM